MTVGDFDGDDNLDIAVASRDSNSVSVLLGDGNGGLGVFTNFAVAIEPQGVFTADLNEDGKLDIITANISISSNSVSVLLGN